jgi:hypothetical protein
MDGWMGVLNLFLKNALYQLLIHVKELEKEGGSKGSEEIPHSIFLETHSAHCKLKFVSRVSTGYFNIGMAAT